MKPIIRGFLACLAALCLIAAPSARAEQAALRFPNGTEASVQAKSLDLSTLTHEQVDGALALLGQMTDLRRIDLGADRALTRGENAAALPKPPQVWSADYYAHLEVPEPETEPERLSWEDIRRIVEAVPQTEVDYRFHIGSLRFSTLSETLDINHILLDDEGARIRAILPCMRNLRLLDMDYCGVDSEHMAAIRDAYPDVEVIWRVWFGPEGQMSVRTDVERILASSVYGLDDTNSGELRWCTRVKYLDVGHSHVAHLDFVRSMPELEVLVVSLSDYCDLSPLEGLEKLEYFEGCDSAFEGVIDLTPLSTCPDLRHINVCCLSAVSGAEILLKTSLMEE